jgi:hypothetical protein
MPIQNEQRSFLGIDPGKQGGIVLLDYNGNWVVSAKMPDTEIDLWRALRTIEKGEDTVTAIIEQVGGYTRRDGPQPGSAAFKFGQGYGALLMGLVAAEIPFSRVIPRTWQKGLGIPPKPKEMSKPQWKRRLKSIAQERFPEPVVTAWMADALLIADYCRRRELGLL